MKPFVPGSGHAAMRLRKPLAGLAAALFATAAPAATRYQCTMIDGTQRLALENLSQRFAAAVDRCVAIDVREQDAALPQFASDGRLPGLRETAVASALFPRMPGRFVGATGAAPQDLQRLVVAASRRYGLDPGLVDALVHVESGYQASARSNKGALGLMQIMPATGNRYGVGSARDLLDPAVNIEVGTRYLRDLADMFDGRVDLVLAAYNAGEGAVKRYGNRVPPYPETQDYVRRITGLYDGR